VQGVHGDAQPEQRFGGEREGQPGLRDLPGAQQPDHPQGGGIERAAQLLLG
jgi:hypothetical protein